MDYKQVKAKCDYLEKDDKEKSKEGKRASVKYNDRLRPTDIFKMSKEQGHLCKRCGEVMNFVKVLGDYNNWSVDRRDESRGHEKGNCFLSHWKCNISKIGDC